MKKPRNSRSFYGLISVLFIVAAITISTILPELKYFQIKAIDRLIEEASRTEEQSAKLGLLQQASLIGSYDPVATESLASFWNDRGEIDKAIDVYRKHISSPDYNYLATLELKAQNYQQALEYAQKVKLENQNIVGLLAIANANYNLGRISEGCEFSIKASKLDLNNEAANRSLSACVVLGGRMSNDSYSSNLSSSDREEAYTLISSMVYKQGEEKLSSMVDKSAMDYLALSKLSAVRGEINKSIELIEQGLALDISNIELLSHAKSLYQLKGNANKVEDLSNKLNQLKFGKYNNFHTK